MEGCSLERWAFSYFNRITSDEQNFQIHVLFCSVFTGGVGVFCFLKCGFQIKGGNVLLASGFSFFPLTVVSKCSYWYLKAVSTPYGICLFFCQEER